MNTMNTLSLEQFVKVIGYNCLLIKRAEDFSQSSSKMYYSIQISYIAFAKPWSIALWSTSRICTNRI
jgi:Na+-translocating ferredoxin:NAD+ oxidoreductase RnfE subunit